MGGEVAQRVPSAQHRAHPNSPDPAQFLPGPAPSSGGQPRDHQRRPPPRLHAAPSQASAHTLQPGPLQPQRHAHRLQTGTVHVPRHRVDVVEDSMRRQHPPPPIQDGPTPRQGRRQRSRAHHARRFCLGQAGPTRRGRPRGPSTPGNEHRQPHGRRRTGRRRTYRPHTTHTTHITHTLFVHAHKFHLAQPHRRWARMSTARESTWTRWARRASGW